MRKAMISIVLALAGCGADSMIGQTVIVTSAEPSKMQGMVLIVDPARDFDRFPPVFVEPFRGVVVEEVPVTDKGTDNELPERWQLKIEDGEARGRVVDVFKRGVKLTAVR